ncbi:methyltransferase domain-containing protein [Marinobacter sp. M216]|uniref:Methyltransferase domain-containing protein n=1 Tax=Marinobacter albus TaxID=3030833 RepID=A0ABT7HEH9_9GAMM|nr:methyltransferase domain-containing protein [Marinobacter sp. M216]MDK9558447.1 methyltransferase domain-containing protein [Marinobacter sp. M216]
MLNKGEIIHHVRDTLGSILVIDYRKHRVLTFNSVFEQSKIDRRRPYLPVHEYNRAMMLPAAFASPGHVTILGLGGGVMASAFHHLYPECHIHAVELRQAVLDVSRAFFSLPQSNRLTVSVGDARNALELLPDASTDMILADLYNADRMSPAQAQRMFINHCSRALSPSGWLALNYHRTPDPEGPYFRQLRKQFPVLLMFRSKTNNTVIYASKKPFEALHERDPALLALEKRLPIGWRKLMTRVSRL